MLQLEEKGPVATARRSVAENGRAKALERLEKKREFRAHLMAYVLVNAFLWVIWGVVFATTGFWFPWPVFPLAGWAIGLSFHAWDAYGRHGFTQDEIDREVARLG